jgi:hypothetical protein
MMHMTYRVTVLRHKLIFFRFYSYCDGGGGILLHIRPIHEPQQNIENTTPTIIPMTCIIGIIDY